MIFDEGCVVNRKHASEIAACYYRLPVWYRKWLSKRGENPLRVSSCFIRLSNSSREHADPHIVGLKKALNIDESLQI